MMGFPPRPLSPTFWQVQCPARGPGLSHVHSVVCESEHGNHFHDECCECNLRAGNFRPASPDLGPNIPSPDDEDDEPIEPKMVSGNGPQGRTDGKGRGILTERQQRRLSFLAWLAERGEA